MSKLDSAFTPIAAYGLVGDRRTAALISDRGRLDWLALPDFDGRAVFGRILDPDGGSWRFGPQEESQGIQQYEPGTCILNTRWETPGGAVELTDFMAWPESNRPDGVADVRLLARRLRSVSGSSLCSSEFAPIYDFREPLFEVAEGRLTTAEGPTLRFWTTLPRSSWVAGNAINFELVDGEEHWAVLIHGNSDWA